MTRRPLPSSSLRASAPTCASSRRRSRFLTSACRTKIYPTRTSSLALTTARRLCVNKISDMPRTQSTRRIFFPHRQGPARLVRRLRRLRREQDPPAPGIRRFVGHQGRRPRHVADLHVRGRLGLLRILDDVRTPRPRLLIDDLHGRAVPVRVKRRLGGTLPAIMVPASTSSA